MRLFFILAFALLFFTSGNSALIRAPFSSFQNIEGEEVSDTTLARSFFNKGNDYSIKLEYDSSIIYINKARQIFEKDILWRDYFRCINLIALVLREKGDIDSSVSILNNYFKQAEEKLGKNDLIYAKMKNLLGYDYKIKGNLDNAAKFADESLHIQLNNNAHTDAADSYYLLGTIYFEKGEFDKSLENLNLSLEIIDKEEQKILLSDIYNSMGEVFQQKGDPDKAIECYKNSLKIKLHETGELDPDITSVYNNLAVVYFYLGDNDTALEYYLKALAVNLKLRGDDNIDVGIEYNNISMAYRVNGNYDEALRYGGLSKNILIKKLGSEHPTVGAIINNTGRTYSDIKEYDKAIKSYRAALSIWKNKYGEIHPFTAQAYFNIGEALENKGEYDSALQMINKSLSIRLSVWGEKHTKIADSYQELGKIYYSEQNYDSALYFYQKSIISVADGFIDSNVYINPNEDQILWHNELLNSLILKGDALASRYATSYDFKDLHSAYKVFQFSSEIIDKVRHSFKAEGSKLAFSRKAFSVYAKGINISLRLFKLTKNIEYLKTAFKLSEESKAAVLFDAVSEVKAKNFSGIPDSLLNNEKNLRVDIAYYNTQILNEKQKKQPSSEKIAELQDKYFSTHQKYIALLENFEKNFPSYYQLKYKEKNISVENLQNLLDGGSAILEYFLTDTTLYIFVLKDKSINYFNVKLDSPLNKMITQFRESLQNIDIKNYITSAQSLYNTLIKPAEKKISNDNNLIIIPDGVLNYLPFEALLSRDVTLKDEIDFSTLPYLIEKYNISYLFSTSFMQQSNYQPDGYSFAGFAPVFYDKDENSKKNIRNDSLTAQLKRAVEINDKSYSELPETRREVEGILDLFKKNKYSGNAFISESAKEELIKSVKMERYGFIHIATHGFINEEKPKLSGIIFTDKNNLPGEDGILYSDEIYNLNLNADLVVLSACESGLGKVIKGEGIMGLTRGFIYSGAKNVVVSLWQVADKSTSELMLEFYKEILSRRRFPAALREAKLKLIKGGKYSYPLEWSPFVLIGR